MTKQRKYFEIIAGIGRRSAPAPEFPYTAEGLSDDMAYHRVHGALVTDMTALDYSFVSGNRSLCETLKSNPRFVGAAQVPSTALLETEDGEYFEKLYRGGVRAFYAAPAKFRHSLHPDDMEEIARFLTEKKLPLLLRFDEANNAHFDIGPFLRAYPELNVVLLGCYWAFNRWLFAALERHPNLYFDIGWNQANDLLELTKKHFGIERALFGTDWPSRPMGTIKALVEYADLSEKDKDLVAAGNALRLLGLSGDRFPLYPEADCRLDAIAREMEAGKPLSVPVFDAHTHMIPAEDKTVSGQPTLHGDCDSIVKKMDRLGVDSIVTAPWQGLSTDGRAGNAQAVYAAQKYPGRVYGYSTCNIHYAEDVEDCIRYHERYPDIFVGIKPYWPYQKFALTASECRLWYEYADKHRLLLLLHTDSENNEIIRQAEELIVKYPGMRFLLAHSGGDWDTARRNAALAKKYANVYLEITLTSCTRGAIEYLVAEAGADKVLYGSDTPLRDPAPQLAWVAYSKISIEDKKKIFAGNLKRLLAAIV
ncbi:hypothetical protein FACS1894211_08750 [Clostridia bacterium]|nr:hypothetical protein FACS1894211_08750 [Clostridia bacterium]